jgi:predicted  nucleic acid-binding Zn-ribbon protein
VRNNAEYQATLFQIEAVRKDRDVMQEECLKLLELVETQRPEVAAAEAAVAADKKVLDEFLAEANVLRESRAGAIAEVRGRRKAMAEGIPEDLLHEYDGLFKTRDGIAVCSVDNSYCQGCYNKITMNDTARLLGKASVVKCGSCQRILYLNK